MIVNSWNKGKLEKIGTVRLVKGEVVIDLNEVDRYPFDTLRKKFPDGIECMKMIKGFFFHTWGVVLEKEDADREWMKPKG